MKYQLENNKGGVMETYSLISAKKDTKFEQNEFCYTNIDVLLNLMDIQVEEYNWLIAKYECNYYPDSEWEKNRHEYLLVSGKVFSKLRKNNPRLQFIWGVVSAFEKRLSLQDVLHNGIPSTSVEINRIKQLNLQNRLSILEIGTIDSSMFFIVSKEKKYINNLKNKF